MKTNKGLTVLCIILAVCLLASVGGCIVAGVAYRNAKITDSPYVVPDGCNIHVIYPDWDVSQGDPPDDSHGHPFSMTAYPEHWTVGERVIWLKRKYEIPFGYYLVRSQDYFTEENLAFVAWLEAELEFLDSPPLTSIFEKLELNKEDYLVRK